MCACGALYGWGWVCCVYICVGGNVFSALKTKFNARQYVHLEILVSRCCCFNYRDTCTTNVHARKRHESASIFDETLPSRKPHADARLRFVSTATNAPPQWTHWKHHTTSNTTSIKTHGSTRHTALGSRTLFLLRLKRLDKMLRKTTTTDGRETRRKI